MKKILNFLLIGFIFNSLLLISCSSDKLPKPEPEPEPQPEPEETETGEMSLTELWNFSDPNFISGNPYPNWAGDWFVFGGSRTFQRGMAHYKNRLYAASRGDDGRKVIIEVFEAETGNSYERINLPSSITGGTFAINLIAVSKDGQFFLCNLSTNPSSTAFKVYRFRDNSFKNPEIVIDYSGTSKRLGDGFAVYGDMSSGGAGYILATGESAADGQRSVFKWDVSKGVVSNSPEEITLPVLAPDYLSFGFSPQLYAGKNYFYVDGSHTFPVKYNFETKKTTEFTGADTPIIEEACGVTEFVYKGKTYLVTSSSTNLPEEGPKFQFSLFHIENPDDLSTAKLLYTFPEKGMGFFATSSKQVSSSVEVGENEAILYLWVPQCGYAAYKLTGDLAEN